MVRFADAIEIAKGYYASKAEQTITKVYENDSSWIVFASKKGMPRFGSYGISIDKQTAEISMFVLPTQENFEILRNSTLIEIEEEEK